MTQPVPLADETRIRTWIIPKKGEGGPESARKVSRDFIAHVASERRRDWDARCHYLTALLCCHATPA
jgi:hypothetical protein